MNGEKLLKPFSPLSPMIDNLDTSLSKNCTVVISEQQRKESTMSPDLTERTVHKTRSFCYTGYNEQRLSLTLWVVFI